ncbi:MAG: hypothetical protein MUP76_05535, partial [Acidimicrobiia bacterium]|nr:hypothetical protein [Acidimicrobiia bacterium]
MRPFVAIPILALAIAASGCGLLPSQQDACPDTVADPEGGTTDGIDLALPGWLPDGFPVPAGISVRHINDGTPSGTRLITGFVPAGESVAVIAAMTDAL